MIRYFFILLFIGISNLLLVSQLQQIIVLNEGAFDFTGNQIIEPVSLGSWDPLTKTYQKQLEIPAARFASDLIKDGNTVWVAADKQVYQISLADWSILKKLDIVGVRRLAVYKDMLILSRGEYLTQLNAYVQIYDKQQLSLLFDIPFHLMPYTAENIAIIDSFAFIGVNNGFEFGKEVGKVIKIDLESLKWIETIELGEAGKNPENLMTIGSQLYSLNNKNYNGSSISSINLATSEVVNYELSDVTSLCGTSVNLTQNILYQEIGETQLGSFDLNTHTTSTFREMNKSFYGMAYDANNKWICAGETDFSSFGHVFIYDDQYKLLYDFAAGVAPAYFVFDYGITSGNTDLNSIEYEIFPNPVTKQCRIVGAEKVSGVELMDINGRKLIAQESPTLDLSSLQQGIYLIKIRSGSKFGIKRLVKTQ